MDINASSLRKSTYVRVATGSEPATYTWTFSGSRLAAAVIHAYAGVDTANPINAVGGQVNASGVAVTAPSITTTVANTMLVGFFAKQSSGTWTPPAGMTERGEINGAGGSQTTSATGVDAVVAAIGPTGTRIATASSGALNVGHLVALRPAAGP
jgi:MSHA biogenesis protein MshQ